MTLSMHRSPSLLLLISLVVLLLATPQAQAQGRAFPTYVVTLLFALVLFAALHATAGAGRRRALASALGVAWIVFSVWNTATGARTAEIGAGIVFIAFASIVIGLLIRRIVSAERVDFEVVCASPSVYLLIAIAWAVSYQMIETLAPGSFVTSHEHADMGISGFLYFSFTTITTLGYGDITPVHPTAGIWSTLEAVTGVFFMAILVARLVSLYRR